ncbi:MAG: type II toxin-antitoxin system RelE/ParE family toxin [Asticcacaulis sp.]|uniref:type II toxin-antitoxin system RelE/ParE family toxin n=1 Tax=Asticcacaulis sp. TaxID=1872648 RepID=UPI003F7B908E
MARLLRSAQALRDLDDIWFYIAQDNLNAADAWLDHVFDKATALSEQPLIGRARPELDAEIRSLPVGAYMLYYRPLSDGVELVRVLHSSRDIDQI